MLENSVLFFEHNMESDVFAKITLPPLKILTQITVSLAQITDLCLKNSLVSLIYNVPCRNDQVLSIWPQDNSARGDRY
jgi:hypothetical protein